MSTKKRTNVVIDDSEIKPRYLLYTLFMIIIICLVIVAQYFTRKKIPDTLLSSIVYTENGHVSYGVTYNDNPILEEKNLGAGKTYISQYIDVINTKFDYRVNYTDLVAGNYSYQVKAKLLAFTPGDEADDLWSKDYILSDKQSVDFVSDNNYQIYEELNIDYQQYLNDYLKFKSSSAVSSSAKLIVELVINNKGEYKGVEPFKFNNSLKVEIPVGESTFKITPSTDLDGKSKDVTSYASNKDERLFVLVIAGLCWILALIMTSFLIVIYRVDNRRVSAFTRRLKKIINTYDSIIVNVEKLPVLENVNVVNVTSFEELVDAQNEVRLPINYTSDKKKRVAKFVLVRNNLAWVYILKESDSSDEK